MNQNNQSKHYTTFTRKEKDEIYEYYHTHPELSQKEFLQWIEQKYQRTPSKQQLHKIINKKYQSSVSRVHSKEFEKLMIEWINTHDKNKPKISEKEIREKGKSFQQLFEFPNGKELNLSNGWIYAFKKRHGLFNYDKKE